MIAIAVLLWVAAGYRLWLVVTRPRTLWRMSFMIGMLGTAASFTLWLAGPDIDGALGLWNLSSLLTRVVLVVALGFTCVYVDALRYAETPRARVVAQCAIALVACLLVAGGWTAAPIHAQELPDLMVHAEKRSVVIYCVAFWAYVAFGLAQIAALCLARGRLFRRGDPARSIALFMIGMAALLALPVMALWTAALIGMHVGLPVVGLKGAADMLIPLPLAMLTTGVLALAIVPWAWGVIRSTAHLARLTPMWRAMIERHPDLHLDAAIAGGPLSRLRTAEARAIVEIRDALRLEKITVAGPVTIDAVARAISSRRLGATTAADLLGHVSSREADTQQILSLADAFKAAAR